MAKKLLSKESHSAIDLSLHVAVKQCNTNAVHTIAGCSDDKVCLITLLYFGCRDGDPIHFVPLLMQ